MMMRKEVEINKWIKRLEEEHRDFDKYFCTIEIAQSYDNEPSCNEVVESIDPIIRRYENEIPVELPDGKAEMENCNPKTNVALNRKERRLRQRQNKKKATRMGMNDIMGFSTYGNDTRMIRLTGTAGTFTYDPNDPPGTPYLAKIPLSGKHIERFAKSYEQYQRYSLQSVRFKVSSSFG